MIENTGTRQFLLQICGEFHRHDPSTGSQCPPGTLLRTKSSRSSSGPYLRRVDSRPVVPRLSSVGDDPGLVVQTSGLVILDTRTILPTRFDTSKTHCVIRRIIDLVHPPLPTGKLYRVVYRAKERGKYRRPEWGREE